MGEEEGDGGASPEGISLFRRTMPLPASTMMMPCGVAMVKQVVLPPVCMTLRLHAGMVPRVPLMTKLLIVLGRLCQPNGGVNG